LPSPRTGALAIAAVLLTAFFLFRPVVDYPLVWDDKSLIEHNPYLADFDNASRVWNTDFWELTATPHRSGMYRPLVTLSYFVEARLQVGSHAVNLLIHLLNILLLGALALRVGLGPLSAAACCALFAFHPALVEPVANIAGRTDALACFWLLAAIHMRWRLPALWAQITSGVMVLLALLSKESAVVALPLLLLVDWRFGSLQVTQRKAWLRSAAAPLAATVSYFLIRKIALGAFLPTTHALSDGQAPWQFWDGAVRSCHYLFLLIWPSGLTPHHLLPETDWIQGAMAIMAFLVAAYFLWKKLGDNARFGAMWFVIALAPIAHWLPLQVRFSGLFLYLPLIGVTLALAAAFQNHRGAALAGLAASVVLAVLSTAQIAIWSSGVELWQHAVDTEPESAASHLALGHALQDADMPDASQQFTIAYSLAIARKEKGTAAKAAFSQGNLAVSKGASKDAIAFYEQALKASGGEFYPALLSMARIQLAQKQLTRAQELARKARQLAPHDADVLNLLGIVAARMGRPEEALAHFEEAVQLRPGDMKLKGNLEMLRERYKKHAH
jgi:tetratricopeptide (TPR) repeat protein